MEPKNEPYEKIRPEGIVETKLKFQLSPKDQRSFIAFVSQDLRTGRTYGVNADSTYPKKICIVDKNLNDKIIPGLLYDVALTPMKSNMGYIVIKAEPHMFKARISTTYVPKAVYQVIVSFGNKRFIFDPLDGVKYYRNTLQGVKEQLEKRCDIANLGQVLAEFELQANNLLRLFSRDGYYVKDNAKAV